MLTKKLLGLSPLLVISLVLSQTIGCSKMTVDEHEAEIRDAATQISPTSDPVKLDEHRTLIKAKLATRLKSGGEAERNNIMSGFTSMLVSDFRDVYSFRKVAPAESARYQATVQAGIELFRDHDTGWGDRTFQKLIPSEEQFAKWVAGETQSSGEWLNWLEGLRQTKETLLNVSGSAVSNESIVTVLTRFVDLTFDCHSDKNQMELASAILDHWGNVIYLVRDKINQRLRLAEGSAASDIYQRYGQKLALDEPLSVVLDRLRQAARGTNFPAIFDAADFYRTKAMNIATNTPIDPIPSLKEVFAKLLEKPLAVMDRPAENRQSRELAVLYSGICKLDSRLYEALLPQIEQAFLNQLNTVLASGETERVRLLVDSAKDVEIDEVAITNRFLPQITAEDNGQALSKILNLAKVLKSGEYRTRLISSVFDRQALDEARLEQLLGLNFERDEIAQVSAKLRALPIDQAGRFNSEKLLQIAIKMPQGVLRTSLFETTISRATLGSRHLDITADAGLPENEERALLEKLKIDGENVVGNLSDDDLVDAVCRIRNPKFKHFLLTELVNRKTVSFDQIDRIVTSEPSEESFGLLKVMGSRAIHEALQDDSVGKTAVREFYQRHVERLQLEATHEIAQATFDHAIVTENPRDILHFGRGLLGYPETQSVENAKQVWQVIERALRGVATDTNNLDGFPATELLELALNLNDSFQVQLKEQLVKLLYETSSETKVLDTQLNALPRDLLSPKEMVEIGFYPFADLVSDDNATIDRLSVMADRAEWLVKRAEAGDETGVLFKLPRETFTGAAHKLIDDNGTSATTLARLFEIVSCFPGDMKSLEEKIAVATLKATSISETKLLADACNRYLKYRPKEFEHDDVALTKLLACSFDQQRWLDADDYCKRLSAIRPLVDAEKKFEGGIREAAFAARLAEYWKGRHLPFYYFNSDGESLYRGGLLLLDEIEGNRVKGSVFTLDRESIRAEITAEGLKLTFPRSESYKLTKDQVVYIGSRHQTSMEALSEFDFGALRGKGDVFGIRNDDGFKFYIVSLNPDIKMIDTVVALDKGEVVRQDLRRGIVAANRFRGNRNGKSPFFTVGHAFDSDKAPSMIRIDTTELAKEANIRISGRAYVLCASYESLLSRAPIIVYLDSSPNPHYQQTVALNASYRDDSFTDNDLRANKGELDFSIVIPKGTRKIEIKTDFGNQRFNGRVSIQFDGLHATKVVSN